MLFIYNQRVYTVLDTQDILGRFTALANCVDGCAVVEQEAIGILIGILYIPCLIANKINYVDNYFAQSHTHNSIRSYDKNLIVYNANTCLV